MPDPIVSIVIAAVNEWESLEECLGCFAEELDGDDSAELIVASRRDDLVEERVANVCSRARLIRFVRDFSIPRLRAEGIAQSRGEWVVILEDHCMVEAGWLNRVLAAIRECGEYGVIGGAVANGSCDRLIDWAAFLCEYSFSMPPLARGEAQGVTGNNVCYRRAVITAQIPPRELAERWEYFWHQRLRRDRVRFFCAPEIVVRHKKRFPFGYFMRQRFLYSRSFAAMRAEDLDWRRRLVYAVASPLLVPLVAWRTWRNVRRKQVHGGEFFLSLPILLLFLVSYAWGEACGYLAGAGTSLEEVE